MEYGLTTNVQKKIKGLSLAKSQVEDYRFWWEVNLTKVENRNVLVIVHPSSRYSMIYTNLKPSIWKNLDAFISEAIKDALLREGFTEADVRNYFQMSGDNVFTKTHGRQATGGLNHITGELWYHWDWYDPDSMLQERITHKLNDEPVAVALHPEYTCVFSRDYFVNEMRNLLYGEKMKLHYASMKGGITIRDGEIVER
jgi:hypothetical protein